MSQLAGKRSTSAWTVALILLGVLGLLIAMNF